VPRSPLPNRPVSARDFARLRRGLGQTVPLTDFRVALRTRRWNRASEPRVGDWGRSQVPQCTSQPTRCLLALTAHPRRKSGQWLAWSTRAWPRWTIPKGYAKVATNLPCARVRGLACAGMRARGCVHGDACTGMRARGCVHGDACARARRSGSTQEKSSSNSNSTFPNAKAHSRDLPGAVTMRSITSEPVNQLETLEATRASFWVRAAPPKAETPFGSARDH